MGRNLSPLATALWDRTRESPRTAPSVGGYQSGNRACRSARNGSSIQVKDSGVLVIARMP